MDPMIPYIACLIGAAVLYVLVRPPESPKSPKSPQAPEAPEHRAAGKRIFRVGAGIVGLVAFGWLMMESAERIGGQGERPGAFFMIFSIIAIASAVRMITHSRPVYSALYFVMVVLSSAGLFLLLHAEFMAFALIIVYAGAILITYMFVLMLAQQAATPDNINEQPAYDRIPREPASAVVVGFIMLALLTSMIYGSFTPEGEGLLPPRISAQNAQREGWLALDTLPRRRDTVVGNLVPEGSEIRLNEQSQAIYESDSGGFFVDVKQPGQNEWTPVELPEDAVPQNIQRVGLALVADFPVSLELAGVILLMAMFGAVVLARRQIELGEMELHALVGMPHYGDKQSESESPRVADADEPGELGGDT